MADEEAKSIKEKIQEKLGKGGKIGASDIADFSTNEEEVKDDSPVKIENDSQDPLLAMAEEEQPFQRLNEEQVEAEAFGGYNLGLMNMEEEPEITEDDKNKFMDCLVDDTRFTKRFSLFGGRITGILRSRTTEESMAIIAEVTRQQRLKGGALPMEYAAMLRHASLAFQVAELNGVMYEIPEGPLKAKYILADDKVEPPAWTKLSDKYANMEEGLEQAIYSKLMEFERIYWTMVKNAANQDFWLPEDSSTD